MSELYVAVVEGDGIGKEVIPVAVSLLREAIPEVETVDVEVGMGRWERTGSAIGDGDMDVLRDVDAVLFGAITTPPDPEYRSVLLQIRHELDLYANVRPVMGIERDLVIVRENTEGLYSGIETLEEDRATTLRVVTRSGSERIARYACGLAADRRGEIVIGHKSNVIKADNLFRTVCLEQAAAAGIGARAELIDSLSLNLLLDPEAYDVIVTTNMFGDILSDVASYLVGGLGMLPSANIGEHHALFEPVHGSAPDIAGRGIANPIAAIRSVGMLIAHLSEGDVSDRIEAAIQNVLMGGVRTRDMGGSATTAEFGTCVLKELQCILRIR